MEKKFATFKTKGMNRDLSVSAFNPEFSFENKNLRLLTNDDNTFLSWVNEKGTSHLDLYSLYRIVPAHWEKQGEEDVYEEPEDTTGWTYVEEYVESSPASIEGTVIGTAVIDKKLILFVHKDTENTPDTIYALKYIDENKDSLIVRTVIADDLGFSVEHPLETVTSYEAETIQKVYWTDSVGNVNQINVAEGAEALINLYELTFEEEIQVKRLYSATGVFTPGVIQYCFTYVNIFGQETNIFHTTPLCYIVNSDGKAVGADGSVNARFEITIDHVNKNFRKLFVYAVSRSAINAEVYARRIAEVSLDTIEGERVVVNDIHEGTHIDSTALLYIGYNNLSVETMAPKDGVMFYGNLEEKSGTRKLIDENFRNSFVANNRFEDDDIGGTYQIQSTLESRNFAYEESSPFPIKVHTMATSDNVCVPANAFKAREWYRLGIQFQYIDGSWSAPIHIGDKQWLDNTDKGPIYQKNDNTDAWEFMLPEFTYTVSESMQQELYDLGFRRMRAVYAEPTASGRTILCQGVACPTIRVGMPPNNNNEGGNSYYSSWNFRFPWYDVSEETWENSVDYNIIPELEELGEDTLDVIDYGYNPAFKEQIVPVGNYPTYPTSYMRERASKTTLEYWDTFTYSENMCRFRTPGARVTHLYGRVQFGAPYIIGNTSTDGRLLHMAEVETWKATFHPFSSSSEIQLPAPELFIDNTVASLYSPDIEYNEMLGTTMLGSQTTFSNIGYSLNVIGEANMDCTAGSIIIELNGSPIQSDANNPNRQGGVTYDAYTDVNRYVKMPANAEFQCPQIYKDAIVATFDDEETVKYKPYFAVNGEYKEGGELIERPADGGGNGEMWFRNSSFYSWPVYMWHRDGSLNNDCERENRTALFNKKIFAHYRVSSASTWKSSISIDEFGAKKYLKENEKIPLSIGNNNSYYYGSMDYVLSTRTGAGKANTLTLHLRRLFLSRKLGWRGWPVNAKNTGFYRYYWWFSEQPIVPDRFNVRPLYSLRDDEDRGNSPDSFGLYIFAGKQHNNWTPDEHSGDYPSWEDSWNRQGEANGTYDYKLHREDAIGTFSSALVKVDDLIRITYKSTSHAVVWGLNTPLYNMSGENTMPIFELSSPYNAGTFFGGNSSDVIQTHNWIPCGPPVLINTSTPTTVEFKWGDTYFQWYECIKTNPLNAETDKNQVVEVGGFFLESRVNLEGRYDNQFMKPNCSLTMLGDVKFNPVYSQADNYFTYKITTRETENIKEHPNIICYSQAKTSGNVVDTWTQLNAAMGSSFEVDGAYGKITKIVNFNNTLYVFQERALSQILYNDNVQISSADGVPIEIANSEKVRGVKYISTTVGCDNKWSITCSPTGIYFIDSNSKSLYVFNGQLSGLSGSAGMNSWFKQNVPAPSTKWLPVNNFSNFVSYYDNINQEALFINNTTSLAFSEKVGNFTSFYDYGNTSYFCNFEDTGIWVRNDIDDVDDTRTVNLWKHQAGDYCRFFGVNKPYSMILIGNPEPQTDKIFTNLEFRACIEGEPSDAVPFDYLETWDEYQHGIANLDIKEEVEAAQHYLADNSASLNRKFRMWRCDIPRDNAKIDSDRTPGNALEKYSTDAELGVTRDSAHSMDRMRNPWLYLKLQKNAAEDYFDDDINNWRMESLPKLEIHDLVMTYYN